MELPKGWYWAHLGALFDIQQGKALNSKTRRNGVAMPFLRTANVFWGSLDILQLDEMGFSTDEQERLALRPGDLLTCEGGDVGRTAMWRGETAPCFYQNHLHRLRTTRADVEPEFYMRWMDVAIQQLGLYGGTSNKTTIPNLSKNRLAGFLVPQPPISEQRAIAAVLRTVQRAKKACEKVIAATRALKQSLLHHLFTYGPVPFDEADRVVLRETEIGMVPETWRIVRLGDLVDVKGGKRLPKGSTFSIVPTSYPYIRVADFENWSVNRANLKFLRQDDHRTIAQYIIRPGDVYISIAGTIGLVGTVPKELDGANLTENAARLVIRRQAELLHDYLVCYLASAVGQTAIEVRTVKTSQPKLALARIKDIPVVSPILPEQRVIASHLSSVDAKLAAEEKRRVALDNLFQSLLHNLMTGRVRVNHLFDELVGADSRVGPVGGADGGAPLPGGAMPGGTDRTRDGGTHGGVPLRRGHHGTGTR